MSNKQEIAHDLALSAANQMVEMSRSKYIVMNQQGEDGFGLLTDDLFNYYEVAYEQILGKMGEKYND